MEAVLPLVINADQTGYIKGRYIGENVRLISNIISYTAAKNLPGLAVFLAFQKAFDSIEWNFLFKVLDKLNFGTDLKIGYKLSIATSLAVSQTTVQQEHLTQPWENLKALTTKAIHKSFVKHVFEEPTTTLRLIANGLTPDQISKCFNLALSITAETKLTMFQYKTLHAIVFTKSRLFKAKLASGDLCYLCLKTKQDLKHMLVSCPVVSEF